MSKTDQISTETFSQTDFLENGLMRGRFRGYMPVVVDVETGGFSAHNNALLEIAAASLYFDNDGILKIGETFHAAVEPDPRTKIDPKSIEFNGIDPDCALRGAIPEEEALRGLFQFVRPKQKAANCQRSILVGHNAWFDLGFLNAATARHSLKRNPFHPFSSFDTASIAGLAVGQTVLAKACIAAGIEFDSNSAHAALYDTEKTAELFCWIVNRWRDLGGWPVQSKK